MTSLRLAFAVSLLSVAVAAPALAAHKSHRHQPGPLVRLHGIGMTYFHNYGPPVHPFAAYATYDGPLSALCAQGAAAYRGQDGRRHPCY